MKLLHSILIIQITQAEHRGEHTAQYYPQELSFPCIVISSCNPLALGDVSQGCCTSDNCLIAQGESQDGIAKGTWKCGYCSAVMHPICTGA